MEKEKDIETQMEVSTRADQGHQDSLVDPGLIKGHQNDSLVTTTPVTTTPVTTTPVTTTPVTTTPVTTTPVTTTPVTTTPVTTTPVTTTPETTTPVTTTPVTTTPVTETKYSVNEIVDFSALGQYWFGFFSNYIHSPGVLQGRSHHLHKHQRFLSCTC